MLRFLIAATNLVAPPGFVLCAMAVAASFYRHDWLALLALVFPTAFLAFVNIAFVRPYNFSRWKRPSA